jgi:hypothetical protein
MTPNGICPILATMKQLCENEFCYGEGTKWLPITLAGLKSFAWGGAHRHSRETNTLNQRVRSWSLGGSPKLSNSLVG